MPTPNLNIQEPANNSLQGTWDTVVNQTSQTIDTALGSAATLNATGLTGLQILTLAQYGCASLTIKGAPAGAITYQLPAGVGRFLFVSNATTGPFSISFASGSGGPVLAVPQNSAAAILIDSVNGARFGDTIATGAGGSPNQVQINAGGALAGASGLNYNPANYGLTVAGPLVLNSSLSLAGAINTPLQVQGSAVTLTRPLAFQTAAMPIDCTASNVFRVTLSTNMSAPPVLSGMVDGQTINIQFSQDSIGNRSALWPANFRWAGGTPGVLSTAPNAVDLLVATYISGQWLAALLTGFA